MIYGDFDLREGDDDGKRKWGGVKAPAAAKTKGGKQSTLQTPGHVKKLQEDLNTLGFGIIGKPTGHFGKLTRWAVREFQIYAKMSTVAVEDTTSSAAYVDRLKAVDTGKDRYAGLVTGIVDKATRDALEVWLGKDWRCPVVVEAWEFKKGSYGSLLQSNLWGADDYTADARMRVRDFSGYFTVDPTKHSGLMTLGTHATYQSFDGPWSNHAHSWPEAEMTPDTLAGALLEDLSSRQISTFKVVRAVAEVECEGYFDCVNCYDGAVLSAGACQWTMGTSGGKGEMEALMSLYRDTSPDTFEKAFQFFGVRALEEWADTGKPLFNSSIRTYTTKIGWEDEKGDYTEAADPQDENQVFRTWHWFYRFVMLGRTMDDYRTTVWMMARIRIRDVLACKWPARASVPDLAVEDYLSIPATVGDVFTSEKAVALVYRWHVIAPANVVSGGDAGKKLVKILEEAKANSSLDWTTDPTTWTDGHEAELIEAIRTVSGLAKDSKSELEKTLWQVDNWPDQKNPRNYALTPAIITQSLGGGLLETRKSFTLDVTGLQPMDMSIHAPLPDAPY